MPAEFVQHSPEIKQAAQLVVGTANTHLFHKGSRFYETPNFIASFLLTIIHKSLQDYFSAARSHKGACLYEPPKFIASLLTVIHKSLREYFSVALCDRCLRKYLESYRFCKGHTPSKKSLKKNICHIKSRLV
jgi:hypothetical protein